MLPNTTPDGRFVVPWPPGIVRGLGDKFYAVSSGIWIEVPDNTTVQDAQEFFCWGTEARKYWDSNYSDEPAKTIQVLGSKGQKYNVTKTGRAWKCECRGFQYRQDCKHIQNLKILLEG